MRLGLIVLLFIGSGPPRDRPATALVRGKRPDGAKASFNPAALKEG